MLLDRLAIDSAGDAIYIRPGESVVGPVDAFFASIAGASLVNPTLSAASFAFSQTFPETFPDLFSNQTLAVVGRYGPGGTGEIVLRGTRGGQELTRRFEVQLPEYATRNGHVPRIWATRYVGTLLQQIKLGDADAALPLAATAVAARFGVVTEFTNFVLDANGNAVMRYTNVPLDVSGSVAVDTSASLDGYQNSGSGGMTFDNFVRSVGARTLPTHDGWFTDTSVTTPNWVDLQFGSPRFLDLVAQRADYGIVPLLAVARDVAFEQHGVDYRISDAEVGGDVPDESTTFPQPERSPVETHASVRLIDEVSKPTPPTATADVYEDDPAGPVLGGGGCSTHGSPTPTLAALLFALGACRLRRRKCA